MNTRRFALCLAVLLWVQPGRGDTIVLKNGEHVQGQIVGETATDVSIRRVFKNSNIRYVDKINRTDIVRVERTPAGAAAAPNAAAPAPSTRPATPEPASAASRIADKPTFLEAAIKRFAKPDYAGAGLDFTRLIRNSTASEIEELSRLAQDKAGLGLADLAAMAHFQAAMEKAKGRAVKFEYVTDYEKPVLIPMIKEAYEKAVEEVVVAPSGEGERERGEGEQGREGARARSGGRAGSGRGEAQAGRDDTSGGPEANGDGRGRRSGRSEDRRRLRRPSVRGNRERPEEREGKEKEDEEKNGDQEPTSRPAMTIKAWLDHPKDFDGSRQESLAMMLQIFHARSLLTERQRLDPEMKDVNVKLEVTNERIKLDALLAAVKARSGGAMTPKEQEAAEAERRNRIDAARREAWRRWYDGQTELQRYMEQEDRRRQYGQGGVQPGPGAGPQGQQAPAPAPAPAPQGQRNSG